MQHLHAAGNTAVLPVFASMSVVSQGGYSNDGAWIFHSAYVNKLAFHFLTLVRQAYCLFDPYLVSTPNAGTVLHLGITRWYRK